ncbi:MAG: hypothetical protein QOF01_5250 [Thermomicrobiales bacterium]|jgi:hypothetical protein|nr:hypothetical protein [Thermomicrobiales bacterium]
MPGVPLGQDRIRTFVLCQDSVSDIRTKFVHRPHRCGFRARKGEGGTRAIARNFRFDPALCPDVSLSITFFAAAPSNPGRAYRWEMSWRYLGIKATASGPPLVVAGRVQLGCRPASAAPEGSRYARISVLSTLTSHSASTAAPDLVRMWTKSQSQVPLCRHHTGRSGQVRHSGTAGAGRDTAPQSAGSRRCRR